MNQTIGGCYESVVLIDDSTFKQQLKKINGVSIEYLQWIFPTIIWRVRRERGKPNQIEPTDKQDSRKEQKQNYG